jgi:outer membrane putative beta-barrel porin/alpha-amylase
MERNAMRTLFVVFLLSIVPARMADAQQTITDVLSFLMTNRSIPTDDFVRDEQAAIATSNMIANLFVLDLASLPSSSASGFTYRLDPTLGTPIRASESFGPIFTQRSLLAGQNYASFGVSYRTTNFTTIDGRSLRDGTLLSTASILRGDAAPFDVETVSLRIRTDTMTIVGSYGITDRLDISAGIPFVHLSLQGERVDNYRGRRLLQARGTASSSGFGDVVVRSRYNVLDEGASGLSIGAEVRLPTGSEENLLGAGEYAFTPRLIGSVEHDRVGVHGEFGYSFDEVSNALVYSAAVTAAPASRVTIIGELLGRRLEGLGRLVETVQPNPRLTGVDTIRLTSSGETTDRLTLVGGVKWNVASTWLVTASVLRSLTSVGLNADWVPTITFDGWFGR